MINFKTQFRSGTKIRGAYNRKQNKMDTSYIDYE
jgi:hypothetical protein